MLDDWTRSSARAGRRDQVVGVTPAVLADGPARGLRVLDVAIAGGLDVRIVLDRAMDVAAARFRGIPFAWRSPSGDVDPRLVPDHAWSRGFTGGLVTTCGFRNVGTPVEIGGVLEPAMGRVGNIPAYDVTWRVLDEATSPVVEVTGHLDELSVLGHHLHVVREVTVSAHPPAVRVRDTVTNLGHTDQHLMVLYHCNFGWPLVDDHATVESGATTVRAHTANAQQAEAISTRLGPPAASNESLVFEHLWDQVGPRRTAGIWNHDTALHDGPLGVTVSASGPTLPRFFQWTLMQPRNYVVGLEPSSSAGHGYEAARDSGELPTLAPGDAGTFDVEIRVHESREQFLSATGAPRS